MSVPGAVADSGSLNAREMRFVGHGGDGVDAYLVAPAQAQNAPGVIVVHEIFGLTDHIRDVARRFAAIGFNAIALDLYSREGAPAPGDFEDAKAAMAGVPDARVVADLQGAGATLREQPESNGRVGCVGFCSGGRHTLLAACSSDVFDAAVDCWGSRVTSRDTTAQRPVAVIDLVAELSCPLLLVGGAQDANPSPDELAEVRDAAAASGQDVELEIYPDAGHALFNDTRPNYRPDAAFALWTRMTGFLSERLHAT